MTFFKYGLCMYNKGMHNSPIKLSCMLKIYILQIIMVKTPIPGICSPKIECNKEGHFKHGTSKARWKIDDARVYQGMNYWAIKVTKPTEIWYKPKYHASPNSISIIDNCFLAFEKNIQVRQSQKHNMECHQYLFQGLNCIS